MSLIYFTIQDLQKWNSCYDPITVLPNNWVGTAVDMLNATNIPVQDRIWAVLREDLIDKKYIRLFAVWCARQINQNDQRSIDAINIAEKFANGQCTIEELNSAEHSAWCAVTESQNATNTAAAKTAASCAVISESAAAHGASLWMTVTNDSDLKISLENSQITYLINLFKFIIATSVSKSISDAAQFGSNLMVEYETENSLAGITQAGKTIPVANYLQLFAFYLTSGSLYAAITQINIFIADTSSEKINLSPYITNDILYRYLNKIQTYLKLPLTQNPG